MLPGVYALALVVALLAILLGHRLWRHRQRALALDAPLPEGVARTLTQHVGFYRALAPNEQRRFEREVKRFLFDQVITGPRGKALSDELRALVAASAVMLTFGCRGYVYPRTRDIVVYDEAFDDGYREDPENPILGMVHGAGPILFSARALRDGFARPHDGNHVGLHEFAHVLDFHVGEADGVPSLIPFALARPWIAAVHAGIRDVEGHRSMLRAYAATNEAEFFAVATEAFFERSHQLARSQPKLYALLRDIYGQDPASQPEGRASQR